MASLAFAAYPKEDSVLFQSQKDKAISNAQK